jgi:hypothetical protein
VCGKNCAGAVLKAPCLSLVSAFSQCACMSQKEVSQRRMVRAELRLNHRQRQFLKIDRPLELPHPRIYVRQVREACRNSVMILSACPFQDFSCTRKECNRNIVPPSASVDDSYVVHSDPGFV